MSDQPFLVVLLNPRDLVIRAARSLGLAMIVAPSPEAPDPIDPPGPVLRSPWTTGIEDLVSQLRAMDLPGRATCFGFGEIGCRASAAVNERMGWPGSGTAPHELFRDKARLRAAVGEAAGEPVEHVVCRTKDELLPAIARIGFPCVVKPIDSTGSSGVCQLDGRDAAESFVADLDLQGAQVVEEFLAGAEYSVEAVSSPQHGHRILAITEKTTAGPPHFVETGHTLPAALPHEHEAAIAHVVTATLDAADYRYGVSHTEVMLTVAGPRLIESHGRPGGDRISDMLALALGEDVFEQAMAAVIGLPVAGAPTRRRVAGIRYATFDRGIPAPAVDTAAVQALPGVVEAVVVVPAGQVPPEIRRSADRHGFVVAVADTREELDADLARAVRAVTARA